MNEIMDTLGHIRGVERRIEDNVLKAPFPVYGDEYRDRMQTREEVRKLLHEAMAAFQTLRGKRVRKRAAAFRHRVNGIWNAYSKRVRWRKWKRYVGREMERLVYGTASWGAGPVLYYPSAIIKAHID